MTRHYRVKHLGNIGPCRRGRPTRLESQMSSFSPRIARNRTVEQQPIQTTSCSRLVSSSNRTVMPVSHFPPNLAYSIHDQDQCVLCGYQTGIRSNLYRHYRLVHKAENREDIIRIVESAKAMPMSDQYDKHTASNEKSQRSCEVSSLVADERQNMVLISQTGHHGDLQELPEDILESFEEFDGHSEQSVVKIKVETACTFAELRNHDA